MEGTHIPILRYGLKSLKNMVCVLSMTSFYPHVLYWQIMAVDNFVNENTNSFLCQLSNLGQMAKSVQGMRPRWQRCPR